MHRIFNFQSLFPFSLLSLGERNVSRLNRWLVHSIQPTFLRTHCSLECGWSIPGGFQRADHGEMGLLPISNFLQTNLVWGMSCSFGSLPTFTLGWRSPAVACASLSAHVSLPIPCKVLSPLVRGILLNSSFLTVYTIPEFYCIVKKCIQKTA